MMEKNKDILIVIIATLIFGGASKILVGVPYMAWGYFDQLFIAAFILWTFYSAALYVAIKIENRKNENYFEKELTETEEGLPSSAHRWNSFCRLLSQGQ